MFGRNAHSEPAETSHPGGTAAENSLSSSMLGRRDNPPVKLLILRSLADPARGTSLRCKAASAGKPIRQISELTALLVFRFVVRCRGHPSASSGRVDPSEASGRVGSADAMRLSPHPTRARLRLRASHLRRASHRRFAAERACISSASRREDYVRPELPRIPTITRGKLAQSCAAPSSTGIGNWDQASGDIHSANKKKARKTIPGLHHFK
jgi:hypothetical protein